MAAAAEPARVDLATPYLGLDLRSPLVASSGPLTSRLPSLRALEDAGIGAVVLPSLFEEQVVHDELTTTDLFLMEDGNPEASGYFPDLQGYETVADRYLRHVEEACEALSVPVIASLNGTTPGGWVRYARLIEDAGADALELNVYGVVADPSRTAEDVESQQLALVETVRASVAIPLAVKVSPFYTSFANVASRLSKAGADALVLFNRFYQPDVAPDTRAVVPALELSTSSELRLPLRWIGLLFGDVDAQLAASTGVHTGLDAARMLLAGADVVMMTSALLRHGPEHVRVVEDELVAWADEHRYASVAQLRGSASQRHIADPTAFERANYVGALVEFASTFTGPAGEQQGQRRVDDTPL